MKNFRPIFSRAIRLNAWQYLEIQAQTTADSSDYQLSLALRDPCSEEKTMPKIGGNR